MSAVDPRKHEVLARTLDEVKRVRHRRVAWKLAVLPLLLFLGAGWYLFNRGASTTASPVAAVEVPRAVESGSESLTVVEWKGGMPSLVQYSGEDLGRLELTMSLEPVVAFPEEVW